jgi:hypothetical protein
MVLTNRRLKPNSKLSRTSWKIASKGPLVKHDQIYLHVQPLDWIIRSGHVISYYNASMYRCTIKRNWIEW